ncbi:MAG: pantetheine-phosphate adenylyltransferase [Myxococcales bacterium]|nr:pantetheine-phosphate adenylyltransferase [Myxococcales bacterium]
MRVALYPGSFDPITTGHVDIVRRALGVFDRVVVAVAVNARKTPTFTDEERVALISHCFADAPEVEVVTFQGLLVDYCRQRGIRTVLRGLRAVSDFEFEFQLASMNRRLTDQVDYIFMMTSEEHYYISSSLVREVAFNGGDVTGLVPEVVARALRERYEALG